MGRRIVDDKVAEITKDYPHQCGEKHAQIMYIANDVGLPPPVWGEASVESIVSFTLRITPTSVGRSTSQYLFQL